MCKGDQQVGEEEGAGGVESWMNGQDPGIKLFGRMILAPNDEEGDLTGSDKEESLNPLADSDHSSEEMAGDLQLDEDRPSCWDADERGSSSSSSNTRCGDGKPSDLDLSATVSLGKPMDGLLPLRPEMLAETENQLPSSTSCEEMTVRKPEKAAPCPRCDSLDTKFCYFNNYNVNQPRHFCKHCQRYWTAGGTLRNVPVGAGRRKSKHPSPPQQQIQHHHLHLLPFDCLAVRRSEGDAAQAQLQQPFRPILPGNSPSSPAPSTITTHKQQNPYPGGSRSSAFVPKPSGSPSITVTAARSGKTVLVDAAAASAIPNLQTSSDLSSSTDVALLSSPAGAETQPPPPPPPFPAVDRKQDAASGMQQLDAADAAPSGWMTAPFGFFPSPWPPYAFNPGWSTMSPSNVTTSFFHPAAAAAMPPQMYAFPWCHPSMWAAPPVAWAMPWEAAAATMAAASATPSSMMVTPGSSLGKHPRDREQVLEGPLWLPKTLRLDDQAEQVRSSILARLGLNEQPQGIHKMVAHPKAEACPNLESEPLN